MAAKPCDPPRHFYSQDEYFALEHTGDARYEYWEGDVVCMSGGSLAHVTIATNMVQALGRRFGPGPLSVDGNKEYQYHGG